MTSLWQDITDFVAKRIDKAGPFVAIAGAASAGKVKLKLPGESSAGDELYAKLAGLDIPADAEVVVLPMGGKYLVLGQLSRDTPSGTLSFDREVTGVGSDDVPFVGVGIFPQGASQSNSEYDTALASNITHCMYMGRADAAYTNISLYIEVEVAAATITWAEVGVGTSDVAPAFGENMDITRRGYTNVASSFNSTGEKVVNVSVSGISPGDHLWALIGSQATTPYQTMRVNHSEDNGTWGYRSSTRISTMSEASTFTAYNTAETAAFGYWIGS